MHQFKYMIYLNKKYLKNKLTLLDSYKNFHDYSFIQIICKTIIMLVALT